LAFISNIGRNGLNMWSMYKLLVWEQSRIRPQLRKEQLYP